MLSPAWNSSLADAVPREELTQAITAGRHRLQRGASARADAGRLVFAVGRRMGLRRSAVITTLLLAQAIRRWPPAPHPPSRLPAERLWGGMLSALRFARHSQTVLAQLVRTVGLQRRRLGAVGAAAGDRPAPARPRRRRLRPADGLPGHRRGAAPASCSAACARASAWRELVAGGCVVFASAMRWRRFVRWPVAVYVALVVAGASWMAVMSTFNTATQTSAPPWVRSRAVALHTLCALGLVRHRLGVLGRGVGPRSACTRRAVRSRPR